MANRRSLIGEVSLPKSSDKVWNRINVELFDIMSGKMYTASVSLDYAVSENTWLYVYLSNNGISDGSIAISNINGTNYTYSEIDLGSSQGVTVTSWDPLEDDNYKYIVFPIHLSLSNNSLDIMTHLFNFLESKYPNTITELKEVLYINEDKIGYVRIPNELNIYLINETQTTIYVMVKNNSNFSVEPFI